MKKKKKKKMMMVMMMMVMRMMGHGELLLFPQLGILAPLFQVAFGFPSLRAFSHFQGGYNKDLLSAHLHR
jgi:hypothetical protein